MYKVTITCLAVMLVEGKAAKFGGNAESAYRSVGGRVVPATDVVFATKGQTMVATPTAFVFLASEITEANGKFQCMTDDGPVLLNANVKGVNVSIEEVEDEAAAPVRAKKTRAEAEDPDADGDGLGDDLGEAADPDAEDPEAEDPEAEDPEAEDPDADMDIPVPTRKGRAEAPKAKAKARAADPDDGDGYEPAPKKSAAKAPAKAARRVVDLDDLDID